MQFPTIPGLRPTGDRIRETVFNWLTGDLAGARVLDLFAGSGAMGFEALSRGANSAFFVDVNSEACRALLHSAKVLETSQTTVIQARAEGFLSSCKADINTLSSVDILFLDPPFEHNLLQSICTQAADSGILAAGALIYIESPIDSNLSLPPKWTTLKRKTSSEVCYQLLQSTP